MPAELYFGATKPAQQTTAQVSFLQWMDEKGIHHSKCKLCSFPRTGRGVKAAVHLKAGDVVLMVPDDAVLMAETSCLNQRIEKLGISRYSEVLLQSVPLVITTMHEKMRGAGSPWHSYLSILPALHNMSLPFEWEESDRKGLTGTSVLDLESCPPFEHPPADVAAVFNTIVLPFFKALARPKSVNADNLRNHFMWATAIASAYSFELGAAKLQGLVPLWDLLNHVTGATNVRLHHSADEGCLHMIATRKIKKGDELINDYGPLSNSELLRRYGFVEPVSMVPDELRLLAGRASAAQSLLYAATTCHQVWTPPNPHDRAVLHLELILRTLSAHQYPRKLLNRKLVFAKHCGLVPASYRYTIDCYGNLDRTAAELFRLLAMDAKSFDAFNRSVIAWQQGFPPPCAQTCHHSMRPGFEEKWTTLVLSALAVLRLHMRHPLECVQSLMSGRPGYVQNAEQAAAIVALGEWVAVDSCMARVSGTAVDGVSGRRFFLEADSALIPGHDHDKHSTDDLGGCWLLRLCKEWWASAGLEALQCDDGMMDEDGVGE